MIKIHHVNKYNYKHICFFQLGYACKYVLLLLADREQCCLGLSSRAAVTKVMAVDRNSRERLFFGRKDLQSWQ